MIKACIQNSTTGRKLESDKTVLETAFCLEQNYSVATLIVTIVEDCFCLLRRGGEGGYKDIEKL
jgi:hypothetical protein